MADKPRGVTLLELILALSLSVLIMGAIAMMIDLHLRTLDSRRTQVEEAQLARAVMRRIADDLRSAVQYQIIDFSSVEEMAAGAGEAAMGAAAGAEQVDQATSLAGLLTEALPTESTDIASTAAPPSIPGLYGNRYELKIDVSRVPRVDEYQVSTSFDPDAATTDIPSDVKTVAYFLQPDESATNSLSSTDAFSAERISETGVAGRGLVRREVDRAVTLWAAKNSTEDDLSSDGEMLAEEITGLEFRYFDGAEWLDEWDSEVRQGLPMAVAIVVQMEGEATKTASGGVSDPTLTSAEEHTPRLIYRLVVQLPSAVPTAADTERFPTETAEATANDGATSGATNANTQAGGSAGAAGGAAGNANTGNNAVGAGLGGAGGGLGGGQRGPGGGGQRGGGGQGQPGGGQRGGGAQGGNQGGGGQRGGGGGGFPGGNFPMGGGGGGRGGGR